MSQNVKGALSALLAFGIFSAHDVIVKYLGAHYSAFQVVFFSVLFSFPLVTLMLIRDSYPGTLRPVHPGWVAIRTIAIVITGVSCFYAFSALPMAQVYVILFASPLIITLLSIPILGEKVGFRRGAAVLVGLIGVIIVMRPGSSPLTLGHLAALVAAFGGALASVIVRKIGSEERDAVLLVYPMLLNFAVMGLALPFFYKPMPMVDIGAAALIAVAAFIAMTFMIAAYRTGEAAIVAPMQYSQILWATLYGVLFFDEFPDLWTAIGAGVIIASGVYIVLREANSTASENTPVLRSRPRIELGTSPRVKLMRLLRRGQSIPRYGAMAKNPLTKPQSAGD